MPPEFHKKFCLNSQDCVENLFLNGGMQWQVALENCKSWVTSFLHCTCAYLHVPKTYTYLLMLFPSVGQEGKQISKKLLDIQFGNVGAEKTIAKYVLLHQQILTCCPYHCSAINSFYFAKFCSSYLGSSVHIVKITLTHLVC